MFCYFSCLLGFISFLMFLKIYLLETEPLRQTNQRSIYIYYTRTVQTVQYTVYVQGPRKFCDHRKVTCQSATDHPGSSTSPHLPIADLPQAEGQTPPPHEQIQTGKAMVNNGGCHNKQKGLSNMINCENMGIQVID